MTRYGMVIDLARCIGCYGCQTSCKAENSTPPGVTWARVEVQEVGTYPHVSRTALPLLCMHCREPACVPVCPTGATYKADDGIVEIDSEKCIGCRYCMIACPYGARYFIDSLTGYFGAELTPFEVVGYQRHRVGTVTKCDFCRHRVRDGMARGLTPGVDREATPACVINCMAKARFFGNLEDADSVVASLVASGRALQLAPEQSTGPQVYYLPPGGRTTDDGFGRGVR